MLYFLFGVSIFPVILANPHITNLPQKCFALKFSRPEILFKITRNPIHFEPNRATSPFR